MSDGDEAAGLAADVFAAVCPASDSAHQRLPVMAEPLVCGADCDDEGRLHLDLPRSQYQALVRARFRGQRVDVEIRARKAQRSHRQNAAFWAAVTPWARELGYEPNELKDELLGLLWGFDEHPSPLTGEVRRVPVKGRSSKLSTAEFCELMEFAVIKAAETGYVMLLPDEFRAAQRKAAKVAA